jgi:mono/diheme cytochrome c family protein
MLLKEARHVADKAEQRRFRAATRGSGLRRVFQQAPSPLPALAALVLALTTLACRSDMQNQPKYIPLRPSEFFADGRSARPLPEGTVARGELRADKVYFTGKNGDQFVDRVPFPVTREVLDRGQERFNIYCSPCHGRLGNGLGMIVRRGLKRPPSYHIDRLRQIPIGYFYDVMTNGFGAMPDYSAQVVPRDRWAIATYIRVLQYSQMASISDVPPEFRAELNGAAASRPAEPKRPAE